MLCLCYQYAYQRNRKWIKKMCSCQVLKPLTWPRHISTWPKWAWALWTWCAAPARHTCASARTRRQRARTLPSWRWTGTCNTWTACILPWGSGRPRPGCTVSGWLANRPDPCGSARRCWARWQVRRTRTGTGWRNRAPPGTTASNSWRCRHSSNRSAVGRPRRCPRTRRRHQRLGTTKYWTAGNRLVSNWDCASTPSMRSASDLTTLFPCT